MVTELCEGGELYARLIAKGSYSEAEAKEARVLGSDCSRLAATATKLQTQTTRVGSDKSALSAFKRNYSPA
eukprot:527903-Amphidinium_carterae.1